MDTEAYNGYMHMIFHIGLSIEKKIQLKTSKVIDCTSITLCNTTVMHMTCKWDEAPWWITES